MNQPNKLKNIIIINESFKSMPNFDFDFTLIKRNIFNFNNLILIRKGNLLESALRLVKARTILNNCIVLAKANFEPENNTYIADVDRELRSYKGLIAYLGIANGRLDKVQEDLHNLFKLSNIRSELSPYYPLYLQVFKESLIEYMNHFIIFAFQNAYLKFMNFDEEINGKKIVKDKDLFFYFLFLEFYKTSEILGSLSREVVSGGSSSKIKSPDTQNLNNPPGLPPNVKTEESEQEHLEHALDELSSDPFKLEDTDEF